MATILSARLTTRFSLSLTEPRDGGVAADPREFARNFVFAQGVLAGQADLGWADTRSLVGSATEDIDVAGVLTAGLGGTITMAKLCLVYVITDPANLNDLIVSRPASNGVPIFSAAGDAVIMKPGDVFVRGGTSLAGIAVTAGTGDLITFTNAAPTNTISYSVALVGRSS